VGDAGTLMAASVVLSDWARHGVDRRINAERREVVRCIGASVWEDGDETAGA
jgi:hypothetical protein